jgi:hypothetical protein
MRTSEIKTALTNSQQFGNETANWYTLCSVKRNYFIIVINDKEVFFKSLNAAARRISKLINTGN